MEKLSDMPNIGASLEKALWDAHIGTPEELRKLGAKKAFVRLKMRDPTACLSRLCALQGAIDNVRWHHLPKETRQELREFHQDLQGG